MIDAQVLHKSYGTRAVLDGVSLSVPPGKLAALVGPSGAGKTSLLNILGGLDSDFTGSVQVAEVSLAGLSDRALAEFRRERVGFMFQDFHLLEHLSALDNVLLACRFEPRAARHRFRERGRELLASVGLDGRGEAHPGALSGGERQRVALARALLRAPKVLLVDEPTGNLDPATGRRLVELVERFARETGAAAVIATHDPQVAARADFGLRLEAGRLEETP